MKTPKCQYCGKDSKIVKGDVIYPDLGNLHDCEFALCEPCGAYVGWAGEDSAQNVLLADKELREARQRAHIAFDPIWQTRDMTMRNFFRREAYKWLAGEMGLKPHLCHMSMFTKEQCARVVTLCIERERRLTQ